MRRLPDGRSDVTRVAAIDCGTNSIRLLVADLDGGTLVDRHREMRIVRLGQDVDRTGRLAVAALGRARAALHDYAGTIASLGAERTRMVATSALRDASNRSEFVDLVRGELGIEPEIVPGVEEAELSYRGAARVIGETSGPVLLADIGGGSTELVRGGDGPVRAYSMDVGAVRLTERHIRDDPPTPAQQQAVRDDVLAALAVAGAEVPLVGVSRLVGVAGTVTTVAALALGLDRYDSARVDGARLSARDVHAVTDRLLRLDHDGRAALAVIHPGRVDVIAAGALVLDTVVGETGVAEVVASEHDILDGIALSLGRQ